MYDDLSSQLRRKMQRMAARMAAPPAVKPKVSLDSAASEVAPKGAGDYAAKDIAVKAVATLQAWIETEDLGGGETLADRLLSMFVGIADENQDGEIDDNEQFIIDVALEAAWDYLLSKGVSEEDCSALLNDWDNDAAERISDLLAGTSPDGDEGESAELNQFVFGEDALTAMDSAVYKRVFAVRNGKKMRVKKRISGTVRLTAKQKVSIRRAIMKSHSAQAQAHRMRSMRLRSSLGL